MLVITTANPGSGLDLDLSLHRGFRGEGREDSSRPGGCRGGARGVGRLQNFRDRCHPSRRRRGCFKRRVGAHWNPRGGQSQCDLLRRWPSWRLWRSAPGSRRRPSTFRQWPTPAALKARPGAATFSSRRRAPATRWSASRCCGAVRRTPVRPTSMRPCRPPARCGWRTCSMRPSPSTGPRRCASPSSAAPSWSRVGPSTTRRAAPTGSTCRCWRKPTPSPAVCGASWSSSPSRTLTGRVFEPTSGCSTRPPSKSRCRSPSTGRPESCSGR